MRITKMYAKNFSHHQNSIKNFQTQLRHVVLCEKCVETCEKVSNFKALRHFGATPKPWVAGSSPPASAEKKDDCESSRLFSMMFAFSK